MKKGLDKPAPIMYIRYTERGNKMLPTYDELRKMAAKPKLNLVAKFSFVAGALLRGSVRNALRSAKFQGLKIDWMENKGLIDSEFLVKGKAEDVLKFKNWLEQYAD